MVLREASEALTPEIKPMEENEKEILTRRAYVSAAECNAQQELGLPMLAQQLIDVATEHANLLGVGNPNMPSPTMGWVLSRLTIEMERWPKVNTDYSVSTWVEDWNRHFSRRAFSITDSEGQILGYARSIWMVLNMADRSNAGLGNLHYDREWLSKKPCPIATQEKHQKIESGAGGATLFRFKYCDIDFYRHVNTVRYIDLLLNQFEMEIYDRNSVGRLELSFLHEGNYGQTIEIRAEESATTPRLYRLSLTDASSNQELLYARIRFRPRD